jgi:AbrB family looped-hinge helix DNA binding protein
MQEKRVWAVKIDERGRMTIPKDLLDLLGIKPDGILAFVREGEGPLYVGRAQFQVEIPFLQKSEEKAEIKKTSKKREESKSEEKKLEH